MMFYCSAGVGRTGTFIAIDIELQRIKQEGVVDVYNTVYRLRSRRSFTVQTLVTYYVISDTWFNVSVAHRLSMCLCLMLLWSPSCVVTTPLGHLLMLLRRGLKSWQG